MACLLRIPRGRAQSSLPLSDASWGVTPTRTDVGREAWVYGDVLTRRKGERMTEEGTLSILRREDLYNVRYASNNPHSVDREPYQCTDEEKLGAFLQQLKIDAWYIKQAFAELCKRGFTALPIVLPAEQMQVYFLPQRDRSALPIEMAA